MRTGKRRSQFLFHPSLPEPTPAEQSQLSNSVPADPSPQSEAPTACDNTVDDNVAVVKDVDQLQVGLMFRWCVWVKVVCLEMG